MTDIPDTELEALARGLTQWAMDALATLPLPRDANPVQWIAARPYSSTWRKSSGHWAGMLQLERVGVVERKVSRGETLWRPTRDRGLALRSYLERTAAR